MFQVTSLPQGGCVIIADAGHALALEETFSHGFGSLEDSELTNPQTGETVFVDPAMRSTLQTEMSKITGADRTA